MTFLDMTTVIAYGETVTLRRIDRGSLTYQVIRSTGEIPGQYTRLNEHTYECVATSWRTLETKQCSDPIRAIRWIMRHPSYDEAQLTEYVPYCPACGEPIDYCQGHGELGDPFGRVILTDHDNGKHTRCHPNAECEA